jgi:hypothetical protein
MKTAPSANTLTSVTIVRETPEHAPLRPLASWPRNVPVNARSANGKKSRGHGLLHHDHLCDARSIGRSTPGVVRKS